MQTTTRAGAAVLMLALAVTLVSPALAANLPEATSVDVHESYRLLTTSYYKRVEPQVVLDGAIAGMSAALAKRHIRIALPVLHASGAETPDRLDAAIAQVASDAHISTTDAAYAAIGGMAHSLGDRYTVFMSPGEYKTFNDELDPEKISGIGVIIGPDASTGYIEAAYVVPGTPADRAGLHSGDDFVSIAGESTKGMKIENVTKVLRGKPGTIAHVIMSRDGKSLPPFAIVRANVEPPTVVYRVLPGKVGYLAVFTFGKDTPQQFALALDRVRKHGARALVIDLRNNGGGYVDSALEIISNFVSNKAMLTVEQRGQRPETVEADDSQVVTLPMTVLVNQYSASASEITAGALQDDGVGTLVGAKTFGKGVMQTVTPLPDGSAIKITTAHYLTPSNRDINLRGIEPDVRVVENKDPILGDPQRDAQLRAALLYLQKKIALERS